MNLDEEYSQPVRVQSNTINIPVSNSVTQEFYEAIRTIADQCTQNRTYSLATCNVHRVGYITRMASIALQFSGVGYQGIREEMCEIFAFDGARKIDHDDIERIKLELTYHWTLRDSQFNNLEYEFDIDDNIMFARGTYKNRPAVITANLHDNRMIRYYTVTDYDKAEDADNHFEDLKSKYL